MLAATQKQPRASRDLGAAGGGFAAEEDLERAQGTDGQLRNQA